MKILYLECAMGAAGDMLLGALLELLPDKAAFLAQMNQLGLPGVSIAAEPAKKCGVHGTRIHVHIHGEEEQPADVVPASGPALPHAHAHAHAHNHDHDHAHQHDHMHAHEHMHAHAHRGMADIQSLLDSLPLPPQVRQDAEAVYQLIAAAESQAHACSVEQIHFHEVGALDAVADITGVCLALSILAPERILASPVAVGNGHVHCAHGILPVPAPATALLLQNIPSYAGEMSGELCTPTGAALLRHFAQGFCNQPLMRCHAIGYGMGSRDFPQANCIRAFWGEDEDVADAGPNGTICELCCNLDDMTAEDVGYAIDALLAAGALDVFTLPAQMKKQRPGLLFTCICRSEDADRMAALLLQHTTSFGLRRRDCTRYTLARESEMRQTPLGGIRFKRGFGYGTEKEKPEYEDIAAAARREGISLREARERITRS